jgi:hypothetical protein
MYGAGRRELFVLHDHVPTKKLMDEKSGFGVIGTGVASTWATPATGATRTKQAQNARTALGINMCVNSFP